MISDGVFSVRSPATGEVAWQGEAAGPAAVAQVVSNARAGLNDWATLSIEARVLVLERFRDLAHARVEQMAARISLETGKPVWEALSEAKLLGAKVDAAIDAHRQRAIDTELALPQGTGRMRHCPIGVMAVLGPFNFPVHLPNGHIVPALLAGNTVVFKASERTPGCGELLVEMLHEAGVPESALVLLQGGRQTGAALVDANIDGVLFTGSSHAGRSIHRALAGRPQVLLAMEMGGNNPIIVHEVKDLDAAAYTVLVSAYITAGQRCTCARRLIVVDGPETQRLLGYLKRLVEGVSVGLPGDEPAPFMGPVIDEAAADHVLAAQAESIDRGAKSFVACRRLRGHPALLSPGLLDVTEVSDREDDEIFGPLLQLVRVSSLDEAIDEANATDYGLAASILSDQRAVYERVAQRVRVGVLNWNQPTTGASGRLPFGGLGDSGNHRPSGFCAVDYCVEPVAVLEAPTLSMPQTPLPGVPGVSGFPGVMR